MNMANQALDTKHPRIRVARHAGFCFGVERAMNIAMASPDRLRNGDDTGERPAIYTFGPLIHNPQVVQRLEERGVRVVDKLEDDLGGTLLIRPPRVPEAIFLEAERLGIPVVDATCPFVRRVQERARALESEGYEIVIVGEREHPEVVGIVGWVRGQAHVVEGPGHVDLLPTMQRVGVVAQTTQTLANLTSCVSALLPRAREVRVHNTLCDATTQRQGAAAEVARGVPVMLVVGGTHSGNTRRLVDICREQGATTYHIETADDMSPAWFEDLRETDSVGVTAGASTPDWIIADVLAALGRML